MLTVIGSAYYLVAVRGSAHDVETGPGGSDEVIG
jgi:hypothetical protein